MSEGLIGAFCFFFKKTTPTTLFFSEHYVLLVVGVQWFKEKSEDISASLMSLDVIACRFCIVIKQPSF